MKRLCPPAAVPAGSSVTFTAAITAGGGNATYTSNTLKGGDLISGRVAALGPCAAPNNLTSAPLRISDPTGIPAVNGKGNWKESLSLHPNPSSGRFTLSADWGPVVSGERVQVSVVNDLGQVVFSNEVILKEAKWNLEISLNESVANGLFLL